MLGRKRTGLFLIVLAWFFAATAAMPFFHTERTATECASCPACHFQSGSLATGQITLFDTPELSLLEWTADAETARPHEAIPPPSLSRAPPAV